MSFKSILKPEGSMMAGIATVVAVYGIYNLAAGSVAQCQASDANMPLLETSRKKAGIASLTFVAALVLLTKDANIGILGGGTIIATELMYRHAIMADPLSGKMQAPNPATAYAPAENVIPLYAQGETG